MSNKSWSDIDCTYYDMKEPLWTKREVRPSISCEVEYDAYGNDYDCGYGSGISCENCVCNGGNIDPRTNEKFIPIRVKINKIRRNKC